MIWNRIQQKHGILANNENQSEGEKNIGGENMGSKNSVNLEMSGLISRIIIHLTTKFQLISFTLTVLHNWMSIFVTDHMRSIHIISVIECFEIHLR